MYWLDRQIIQRVAQPLVNFWTGSSTTAIARFLLVGDMTTIPAVLVAHFVLCGRMGWVLPIEGAAVLPVLVMLYHIVPFLTKAPDTRANVMLRVVLTTWFVFQTGFIAAAYYLDHSLDAVSMIQHLGFGLMTAAYYAMACKQPPEKRRRQVRRLAFSVE